MASWPATVPTFQQILADSYTETAPNNVIRTEMEIGPAKLRQRGTAAPELFAGVLHMTTAQVATFRTFYDSTIGYGALEFSAVHPRTGGAVSARFVGQPQIAPSGIDWNVSITVEILP